MTCYVLIGTLKPTHSLMQTHIVLTALAKLCMLRAAYPSSLSVCPSHSGIVSERGNADECGVHCRVSQCL